MPVFIHVETNVVNIWFLMSYDDNLENKWYLWNATNA